MKLRIFRQPTKDIQPNGEFYTDKLQYQDEYVHNSVSTQGISGIPLQTISYSDWIDVPIIEADSY
jgi:hypothetical protein